MGISSLQRDLKQMAVVAETYTSKGLSYVLRETALALLRHSDYRIYAYSYVDVKWGMYEGERRFNQLSVEERAKINVETLVDKNNIKMRSSYGQRASGFSNEYMVVTILVAAQGLHKLPSIKGSNDLKEALQMLATIPTGYPLLVEVFGTPKRENDTFSELQLLEDYPLLKPL